LAAELVTEACCAICALNVDASSCSVKRACAQKSKSESARVQESESKSPCASKRAFVGESVHGGWGCLSNFKRVREETAFPHDKLAHNQYHLNTYAIPYANTLPQTWRVRCDEWELRGEDGGERRGDLGISSSQLLNSLVCKCSRTEAAPLPPDHPATSASLLSSPPPQPPPTSPPQTRLTRVPTKL
jgi:hypothetical protein